MFSKLIRILFLAVIAFPVCGCSTIIDLFTTEDPISAEAIPSPDGPTIRPGVKLIVQVGAVGQPPAEIPVLVNQRGEVTIPYLLKKPIKCDGMTLEAFTERLIEEYKVYIKNPHVFPTFAPFDGDGVSPWGSVKVMGEVGTQGPVNMPQTMDLTVTQALRAAGGVQAYGDSSRIIVWRCNQDGTRTKFKINLNRIGEKGRIDEDMRLKSGDVVYVPETWL